jgi:tetratricopeptide (TPR) repeat protein
MSSNQDSTPLLRTALAQHFNLDELKILCSDAGVDPESVPYSERGKEVYAYCIIETFRRRGRLPALLSACAKARPDELWSQLPVEDVPPAEWAEWFSPQAFTVIQTGGGDFVARDKRVYIRIGKLNVPILPAIILPALILFGVAAILFILLRPKDTGPHPMDGIFNVVVADFGEVDAPDTGLARPSAEGQAIAGLVFEEMNRRLEDKSVDYLRKKIQIQHESVGMVQGATREARQRNAAEMARAWNADVVIFGNITKASGEFQPEFYVSPDLTGAEESTGPSAFGAPIIIEDLSSAQGKAALSDEFFPRSEALSHFLFGMAFLKVNRPEDALQQFDLAFGVKDWGEQERQILRLWQGTAYTIWARDAERAPQNPCPDLAPQAANYFACAQAAYEEAKGPAGRFARAYLGLGKVIFDQAQASGVNVMDCAPYTSAAETFLSAIQPGMEAAPSAFVPMKAHLNAGIAYRIAYEKFHEPDDCGVALHESAVANLQAAIDAYAALQDPPALAQELAARAYYEMGRTLVLRGAFADALASIDKSMEIAEPRVASEQNKRWRSIRWAARQLRAETLIYMAQAGDKAKWADAQTELGKVIEVHQTSKRVEKPIAAHAYHNLGIALAATGQPLQAVEAFSNSLALVKNAAPSDMEYIQPLLWLNPLRMGQAYAALAQKNAADWQAALKAYNEVIALFEAGAYPIDGNFAAEAYDGSATAYESLGDVARARADLQKLLDIAYIDILAPELSEKARNRLESLP